MSAWTIIETGPASAAQNMALDEKLLNEFSAGRQDPILHLYEWEAPSATYGYFIDPYKFLSADGVQHAGLQLARRPTGGGIIFHLTDLAFSFLVPATHPGYSVNTLDNYAYINGIVIEALQRLGIREASLQPCEPIASTPPARHFCMAKPTKYDVMIDGRKVGGGAQRRTRHAFLHQGSLSLAFPDESLLSRLLLPHPGILEAMHANSYALLPAASPSQLLALRQQLRSLLKHLVATNKEGRACIVHKTQSFKF